MLDTGKQRYIFIRLLGEGSTGKVYLAQSEAKQKVVIKQINRTSTSAHQLLKEIQLPLKVGCHKNVICLLEVVETDKYVYLISEYVEGSLNLHEIPVKDIKMNAMWLDILYQIADGLSAIHAHNVVHRDLKLDNIILKGTIPMIIDFDLACVLKSEEFPCEGIAGTPLYLAPEVWTDKATDWFKVDIFALGIVYYLLANKRNYPWPSETQEELEENLLYNAAVPSRSGNPPLDELIMQTIDKDPAKRPTLIEIKTRLQQLIKESRT